MTTILLMTTKDNFETFYDHRKVFKSKINNNAKN